ncbi:MAG TPA: serine/threonine-protein kinase [Phycisphaerales bacterium]|nr:serine/threonine-protein kinase [Phycisphaerales bacterium]
MGETAAHTAGLEPTLIAPPSSGPGPIPPQIGPYRVLGEIGRGGMGAVLRAVRDDDQLKKHVALKLIKKGLDTEDLLTRFRVEKQVLSSLNHPNIARVLDAGQTDDGRPYFVMEYIEGQPITDYCDTQQLTTQERLELFKKVCAAVHAAHQNLIVHRDIKPSNILVNAQGEPKLLDFGIAKLLNADLMGQAMATLPGERLMTPEYASPEQVQGLPITTASDVYSLGVLLYEMLTGRQPYQLMSRLHDELVRVVCEVEPERPSTAVTRPAEVITRDGTTRTYSADEIAKRRAAPASRLKRTLSGDLDNVVLMAMRKSPRRRYASAQAFAEDLANHLEGRPVKARPETLGYLFAKFVQRNRVGVAAAAVVALALSAGGLSAAWYWGQAREQETQRIAAEQEAARRLVQLREFAATFVPELSRSVRRLEGATTAQLVLMSSAVQVLDKLAGEELGGSDPELQARLAEGYRLLGNVRGGARSGNQQDLLEAAACYAKALAAWKVVGEPGTYSKDQLLEWCTLRLDMAVLEMQRGQNIPALAHVDAALAVTDTLEAEPKSYEGLRVRPWGLLTRSDILHRMGALTSDEQGAARYMQQSTEALELSAQRRRELLSEFDGKADARRDCAVAELRRAERMLEAGNLARANELAAEALEHREWLAASDKADVSFQRDLAVTQDFMGDVKSEQQVFDEAVSWYAKAAGILAPLAANDPEDARLWFTYWSVLGKLGYLELLTGQLPQAQATIKRHEQAAAHWSRFERVTKSQRRALALQYRDLGMAAAGRDDVAARRCLGASLDLIKTHGLKGEGLEEEPLRSLLAKLPAAPDT